MSGRPGRGDYLPRVTRGMAVLAIGCLWASGCEREQVRAAEPDPVRLDVSSPAFAPGGEIPREHTCDGADQSPRIVWSGVPPSTRSIALLVTDPDAPRGTFTHWVVYDMPPDERDLEPAQPPDPRLPNDGVQGQNDAGRIGWVGPCPPPGPTHRYLFRVYALDTTVELPPGASRGAVEDAMRGHVVGRGELVGRYARAATTGEPASG